MTLIVTLHGYGASGSDLRGMALPWRGDGRRFVSLDAPTLCARIGPGLEWFSLDGWMPGTPFTPFIGRVEQSVGALKKRLRAELEREGLAWKDLVLMGFSQGAIMALAAGLSEVEPCAGIMAYSGAYLLPMPPVSKPPVLLAHGGMDAVVAPEVYHESKAMLEKFNVPVTGSFSRTCGHWIDPVLMHAGEEFLNSIG